MYHKVDIVTPSIWWVSLEKFQIQISALLQNSFQFVHLDQYDPSDDSHVAITFDDAYENVYRHAFPYLKDRTIPFEVFIIGNHIGKWNDFDHPEMKTRLCTIEHLLEMAKSGGRIQWHSKSHPNFLALSDQQICNQLDIDASLKSRFQCPHFRWFSYPGGFHNERVVGFVRNAFMGAVSVNTGSESDRYRLNRITIDEGWMPN